MPEEGKFVPENLVCTFRMGGGNTLIFVFKIPDNFEIQPLKSEIKRCNADRSLPWCMREMDDIHRFDLQTATPVGRNNPKNPIVSSYAKSAMLTAYKLLRSL
jgi:hypothetical protein